MNVDKLYPHELKLCLKEFDLTILSVKSNSYPKKCLNHNFKSQISG